MWNEHPTEAALFWPAREHHKRLMNISWQDLSHTLSWGRNNDCRALWKSNPKPAPFFWLRLPEDGEAGAGADWPRCCRKPPPDFPNAQRRVRARRVPPLISCSFHLQGGKKGGARPGEGDGFPLLFGMQKELQSHILLYFLFLFFVFFFFLSPS